MRGLFRLDGALERSASVDQWLDAQQGELGDIARTWLTFMRQCGSDVRDLMHDGYATVCVGDAAFAYVGVFKGHVNIGFFHGTALKDPAQLLLGTGKYMRHVKIHPRVAYDRASLQALIVTAYEDIIARLASV